MKSFVGINLHDLDRQDASARTLRRASKTLIKNYQQHVGEPKIFAVIKHLRNYIEMPKIKSLSYTEDLAIAFKFLPDDTLAVNLSKDDKIIALFKNTIKNHGYKLSAIKDKLNFANDWGNSVWAIYDAVHRRNLATAYELLDEIVHMEGGDSDPNVIGLQLAYYIEILGFLLNHIGRNNLIDFYSLVENEYNISLNRLAALPQIESLTTGSKSLCWASLVCGATDYQANMRARKSARVEPV